MGTKRGRQTHGDATEDDLEDNQPDDNLLETLAVSRVNRFLDTQQSRDQPMRQMQKPAQGAEDRLTLSNLSMSWRTSTLALMTLSR
jgi:hypothetical protein